MMRAHGFQRKSAFAENRELNNSLGFSSDHLGQACPQDCPSPEAVPPATSLDPLGSPLGIREVAKLIGCSTWTVRQRYVPGGLPHFRSGPNSKLIFYKNQVIRWLLWQQEKGGISL